MLVFVTYHPTGTRLQAVQHSYLIYSCMRIGGTRGITLYKKLILIFRSVQANTIDTSDHRWRNHGGYGGYSPPKQNFVGAKPL